VDVTVLVIVLIVIALIIVGLVAFFVYRRRRQARAREEYGPEYERMVEERGSEREAEQELRKRRERVESEIQPLSEESRRRYDVQWQQVERTFVDDPAASLDDADRVVAEILTERNFPADSRQEASEGVGVMYSGVVEDFREAQQIHQDATRSQGEADLDQMRQAIQKYRSVYEQLTREG
jgi:FtsZ-interacting cell division protein ZipA